MLNVVPDPDMPTVAGALAAIGLCDRADSAVIVMGVTGNVVRHYSLATIGDTDPMASEALYVASGLFQRGSITRKREKLKRIVWLPFDADLTSHQGVAADERAEFRELPQAELDALIALQRADLEDAFRRLGLPIHRLDYTGYGLAAYIYLDEADQTRIDDAVAIHKSIVARINELAGYELVDPQCVDAGTRVTRIPGSCNNKGSTPRLVRTLHFEAGATAPLGTPRNTSNRKPVSVPATGTGLSDANRAALIAALAPSWKDGQRHAMGVATAGLLAKYGVPEDQAVAINAELAAIAGDTRPEDRTRAVATTYARLRSGGTVQGFSALQTMMPAAVLSDATTILDVFAKAARPKGTGKVTLTLAANSPVRAADATESLADDEWAKQFPPIPECCYYGQFDRYRALMAPTTEAPDVYHLAASLTWFGALVGRTIAGSYASKPLFPNLYTVLIGASGRTRKNTAIERAIELPYETPPNATRYPALNYAINRDVSSAEGLIKSLSAAPWQILYLDEFSIIQKNAQRKGTRTIFDKLIQAYDNPPVMANLSKNDPNVAKNPFLAMIAATQPRRISEQMTSEDIHSGFANRLIYVIGSAKERMARPPDVDWGAAWKLYLAWDEVIRSYHDSRRLPMLRMDRSAVDRWDAWYNALEDTKDRSEDENDMIVRLPVHAQKLALIYAISDGEDHVQDQHLVPALAFVDWMWEVVRELVKGWGIGIDQQIELAIERALKRHGPMSRRNLQRRTAHRRWSGRDFAAVFRAMAENGTVAEDNGLVYFPEYES